MSASITVNGKQRPIPQAMPLLDFLRSFGVEPKLVAVGINGDVVPKSEYAEAVVRPGDVLEVVRMVGGGAR